MTKEALRKIAEEAQQQVYDAESTLMETQVILAALHRAIRVVLEEAAKQYENKAKSVRSAADDQSFAYLIADYHDDTAKTLRAMAAQKLKELEP